jgi:hypothetical protein
VLIMRFRPAGLWPTPRAARAEMIGEGGMTPVITLLEARGIGKRFGGVQALRMCR